VPARLIAGRTMVPLRFLSESLGANVDWQPANRTVAITSSTVATTYASHTPVAGTIFLGRSTVLPVKLDVPLSSKESREGDRFTATLDTKDSDRYVGLPTGTKIEGHVDVVKAKTADAPGVLSLEFDRLRLPNGTTVVIDGSLIGVDNKSVENRDGRLVARNAANAKDTKYVGIGAAGGALIALATKSNVLTSAVIGAALGYLYGQVEDKNQYREVQLNPGAEFGVMLNRDVTL
jgi:hypothetical protein